ncbi:MAG TPA: carboxypeptidase regulatory-like domain-containing protein [Kofleriaceae bacterium]
MDEVAAVSPVHDGYGALPGGQHVATAEALPAGAVGVAATSGYGYRKSLLSADHTLNRALGDLAIGGAPIPHLAIALSLDGRYDKHSNFNGKSDDGYVGDPHLLVRYAAPIGKLSLGGQLGVWVPGKDAPSIAPSAISVDARALLSFDVGVGLLSFNAGFRLDNSASSVDDVAKLSVEDRVSLGVSDYHAALGGVSLRFPLGRRASLELEGSTDIFVGSGAPSPIFRGGGQLGVGLTDALSLAVFVEGAKVPGVSYAGAAMGEVKLIPYEPVVTAGLTLQALFGGPHRGRAEPSQVTTNVRPAPVEVIETADASGIVFDDAGKPVVAANITIKLKNHTGTAVTDSRGAYTVAKLPIGKTVDGKTELDDTGAEVAAEVANKKPGSVTLTLAKGANAVPPITLESALPPGQLRAVIISVGTSRPVAGATVSVDPGGATATSGADGKFQLDLPPGHYKLTVNAKGLAQQQLDVNIEQNGVAIKNIELHK